MNKSNQRAKKTGAEKVHWNLADLYSDSNALEDDLQQIKAAADKFAEQYRDRVSSLDASHLAKALKELETVQEGLGRAHTYAYLNWCTDMESAKRGALLQKVREAGTQIQQKILFFELEWVQLKDKQAEDLLTSPKLDPYRHYLEVERLRKPHVLGEPEEKVLSEKALTGRQAWNRLFDEILGAARFSFDSQELTEQEVLAKLYSAGRDIREQAAQSLTEGLQQHLRELTFIFNIVLADKTSDDRLRDYPHWLSSRNLSNEISPETVQSLIETVSSRYDLVARYYSLKKKLLGLKELHDYDRYAPLEEVETFYSWKEAQEIILQAFSSFHPVMESIADDFLQLQWIDAPIKPGKMGGAFSHGAVPIAHPYVLMNYTGNIRDVLTLAHELGHGVHQYLSRKQGVLQCGTPLTLAETASTFGEMLVFDRLMKEEKSSDVSLSLSVSKIDDIMATVFRQVALNRFEDRIHTARRSQGELSSDHFSELWIETQQEMFQGSVQLGDHYRIWWSYIPHFLHTPGYVYAYAFGELLVLALYARYRKEGDPFAERYLELLEAGGSDWPHILLGKLDVDLNDPDFWQEGLSTIEEMVVKAEELAGEGDGNQLTADN
ncbi:M3 family oligoendopeptidase [Acidobacteria bacterium AH-259-D05]|nr:M3 family oligoendopeptidase [Acidobacteria bacterium AH-259-D05]